MSLNLSLNWKEFLAASGVVASLIFVGMEINQNTRVAQAQARTELANANKEWLMALATDPNLQEVWWTGWQSGEVSIEDLPENVRRSISLLIHHNFRSFENVYFQFEEGLVDESALGAYGLGGPFFGVWRSPFARYQWEIGKDTYDPDFVTFFEELLDKEPDDSIEIRF